MIPCLYDVSETEYKTNGIGKLSDSISCIVTEKRNGSYELKMEYPVDGIHSEELVQGNIILAKPADNKPSQPFRIYKVTSDLSGAMEINARHISYQLNYITVSPTSVVTGTYDQVNAAFDALKKNATTDCPFTFETDIESDAYFGILEPVSFRSALGGVDGSMLDTFGGEFEWDFYTVRLLKSRGRDNGVRIVYGKNLIDFKQEKNDEDVITGVHPFWKDSQTGDVTELTEKTVTLEETDLPYERIGILDCSTEFEVEPTQTQLRDYARSYLKSTSLTDPAIDIDIDFAQLWQTAGYEDIAEAERVSLCDTVHVYISSLGIEVSASVTETEYDVLLERYKSITLSNSPTSSRNSSISLTVATTSQVKSMIAMTDSSIRISVSNIYATKATLENNYSTTVQTQSLIEASADAVTLAFDKKLSDEYSTTEEIISMIQLSEDGITLDFDKKLEDYSTTVEIQSMIRLSEDGITLDFDKKLEYYSTTVEIQSMIEASEEGITLSFDKRLGDYSTTSEVQSLIEASEEGITLSFEKTLGSYSTTTEVQSLIKASEDGIALTYTKNGQVRSQFALESDSITISSGTITFNAGMLLATGDNFSISASGVITTANGSYKQSFGDGGITIYFSDTALGRIRTGLWSDNGSPGFSINLTGGAYTGFGINGTMGFVYNNSLNPNGYTELNDFLGTVRFGSGAHSNNSVYIGSGDQIRIYWGTYGSSNALWDYNSFYAAGDIGCGGTKYRVVDTEHYGKIGMNAFETASAMFGDSGSGIIGEDSQVTVFFASEFTEVIDMDSDYQVFITPVSSGSISYTEKEIGFFTVHGEPGTEFDWMISAHQRDYTMNRMESVVLDAEEDIQFDDSIFRGDLAAEDVVNEMILDYEQEVDLL